MDRHRWVRPEIQDMTGYVPGEQPDISRPLIKLNTTENPFDPPAPVLQAIAHAITGNLRLYPDPSARPVREAAATAYGLDPAQVMVGNGSDDLLTVLLRTFVAPGEMVAVPEPSYALYHTLTQIQGGRFIGVPCGEGLSLPVEALLKTRAKLMFVVRPNAPTGHAVPLASVAHLCQQTEGVVVLDEAYVDFAEDHGLPLLAQHPNLIVTRTFSKSMALAGMRLGLLFASEPLTRQMHKVRDSYNVNHLSQVAAVAALQNLSHYQPILEAIRTERARLTTALRDRGFGVTESQANFVLAQIPLGRGGGLRWFESLRAAGILVRYFAGDPYLADRLRITIGCTEAMDQLLKQVDTLLRETF